MGGIHSTVVLLESGKSCDEKFELLSVKRHRFNESYRILWYFSVVLFIMLCKVVLTFESGDEILKCDHSNESY